MTANVRRLGVKKRVLEILENARKRKYPYVDFRSPSLLSSDCYNWDRIIQEISDVLDNAPNPSLERDGTEI